MSKSNTVVVTGNALADYHFGEEHPFGPHRHQAFIEGMSQYHLNDSIDNLPPVLCDIKHLQYFHTDEYINKVKDSSKTGTGFLDFGDTPARKGIFEAATAVVGSVLHIIDLIMQNEYQRGFVPIAGLHHGYKDHCSGFCVFNDCCIAIEHLRRNYDVKKVLYVDIDAHHGDGILYNYESDDQLFIVDFHEDGRYIFPGSGDADETGTGPAKGSKKNFPLKKHSNDKDIEQLWPEAEEFIESVKPEFIVFQCGADSMKGDPITHLEYSEKTYQLVTEKLCSIADKYCEGRILALGGGGYNLDNIKKAWPMVVQSLQRKKI